jgi:hypothetical protein
LVVGVRKDCVTWFSKTVSKDESIVVVALCESAVPLICWAGAGRAANIAAAAVSSYNPFID